MKNFAIIVVVGAALSLAGCAGAGPNQTIGTGVGAVGGYGVARAMGAGAAGSAAGAVAGALIGNAVGQNMDQNNSYPQRERVIVQERPVYVERYRPITRCEIVRQYDARWGAYRDVRVCRQY